MQPQEHARERGGASIVVLGIVTGAAWLVALLAAIGAGYVAHAELQQAADVAAVVIRTSSGDESIQHAAAIARANGATEVDLEIQRQQQRVRIEVRAPAPSAVHLLAGEQLAAEVFVPLPLVGTGDPMRAPYGGPLVTTHGIRLCPAVATSFAAMHEAAAGDGIVLSPTSGWRSHAEQASLYASLGPSLAAPPGASRHHDGTEVDISVGPAGSPAHRWLQAHGGRYGFIQRYSWEPWHWGHTRGC